MAAVSMTLSAVPTACAPSATPPDATLSATPLEVRPSTPLPVAAAPPGKPIPSKVRRMLRICRRALRAVLPRSLRGRLAAIFAVASTLLVLASGVGLYSTVSRKADQRVDHQLRSRTRAIFASLDKGQFPESEPYAEVITPLGVELQLSPLVRAGEDILSLAQLNFVAVEGQLQIERDIPELGGRARLLAVRGLVHDRQVVVVVGASLEDVKAGRARLVRTLAIGGPLFVALLTLGGWLLAGAAIKPVQRMADEAAAISSADLNRRLSTERSPNELAHLGNTLNAMLGRLESSFQRERTFVDDASHELRTPLAIMSGELELALLHPGDQREQQDTIQSVHEEVLRLSSMAEDLLVLARAGSGEVPRTANAVDLLELAQRSVERIRPTLAPGLDVDVVGNSAVVAFDPARLERVVTNLVTNAGRFAAHRIVVRIDQSNASSASVTRRATEAAGPGERSTLARPTGSADLIEPRFVTLAVCDDGPGFPPEFLPRAFDRFARSDSARTRAGAGTGIGLAIVKALVEAQGGAVAAANGPPLGGAVVTVRLPE